MTYDVRLNTLSGGYTRLDLRNRARRFGGDPCGACGAFIDRDAGFCDCTPDIVGAPLCPNYRDTESIKWTGYPGCGLPAGHEGNCGPGVYAK